MTEPVINPKSPLPPERFKGPVEPDWCPGCGDFAVLAALKKAAGTLGIPPHRLLVVSGIGCSSNLPGFIRAYGFHSLHGRALPVAEGAKLANHGLQVVVTGGDGDGYGIGLGHLIHAIRRNINLPYLVMNNQMYSLTTGQASPTTAAGHPTKSTPHGNPESPLNPMALALVAGATFVARGFSGDPAHLADIIAQALAHKGFALVDIFSPCVTFNRINTYAWFRERVYKLSSDHNPADFQQALAKAFEWNEKIPLGVFYRTERPTYEDAEPALAAGPLVDQPVGLSEETGRKLLEEFM
ncbi:MAG: thiamine pyrophosphate-dependent enzyme [Planctomycetota bacterium]